MTNAIVPPIIAVKNKINNIQTKLAISYLATIYILLITNYLWYSQYSKYCLEV